MHSSDMGDDDRISMDDINFGGPATYRIVVQGGLDTDWSDRLAGMTIHTTPREHGAPHTTLMGAIRDQAQLSGVLDTLYDLHLPILNVEKLKENPT